MMCRPLARGAGVPTEFKVVVEGELSEEAKSELNLAIQKAVLLSLADSEVVQESLLPRPPRLLGIWVDPQILFGEQEA